MTRRYQGRSERAGSPVGDNAHLWSIVPLRRCLMRSWRSPRHAKDARSVAMGWTDVEDTDESFDVADFADAELVACRFTRCSFHGARFRGAVTRACPLAGRDLTSAVLNASEHVASAFTNCSFRMIRLFNASFTRCKLVGSSFEEADLSALPDRGGGRWPHSPPERSCISSPRNGHNEAAASCKGYKGTCKRKSACCSTEIGEARFAWTASGWQSASEPVPHQTCQAFRSRLVGWRSATRRGTGTH